MYSIVFTKKAQAEFLALERAVQERVSAVLTRINLNPYAYAKKLAGTEHYRVRVGDYRIILHIEEGKKELVVLKIGHRKNVYG